MVVETKKHKADEILSAQKNLSKSERLYVEDEVSRIVRQYTAAVVRFWQRQMTEEDDES